jgi:hypothetical protein
MRRPLLLLPALIAVLASAGTASARTTAPTAVVSATLVRTIVTRGWGAPDSPDPSDLAYDPGRDRLILVDGEVEETTGAGWHNVNGWVLSRTGGVVSTFNTTSRANKEPVGVAYNRDNGRLFVSNDAAAYVQEDTPKVAGRFFGAGDTINRFSTKLGQLQSGDSEGLAYGRVGGVSSLFIADGKGKRIWIVRPGANGRFEGGGDDVVTSFDVGGLGQPVPEDVEFDARDGTLWVISNRAKTKLLHVTVGGQLIASVALTGVPLVHPGGLALAPSTSGGGTSAYIADRGIDNGHDAGENDGKIFEVRLGS